MKNYSIILLLVLMTSCSSKETNTPPVKSISSMKNVMWNGELDAKIKLDSILPRKGMYGLGPLENLSGEITIIDGTSYISTIDHEQQIKAEMNNNVGAPFFVYTIAKEFDRLKLPEYVVDMETLELYLKKYHDLDSDFLFKLEGEIKFSKIHVQNLAPNTIVSSPKEAHKGQVNIELNSINAELIGFYSNAAHGVYTHHDTNTHVHFISKDRQYMGHCDELKFNPNKVKLYIAKNR